VNAASALHGRSRSPTPSAATGLSEPSTRASGKQTSRFEFLLFSYLLRFVHREGRIGDFARAGLLFLFDIAFLMPNEEGGENLYLPPDKDGQDPLQDARDALGEFILDGDFAEVMAAGLGAVYSLLPSKLHVPTLAEQATTEEVTAVFSGGMHLGGGKEDQEDEDEPLGLPSSASQDVRGQLDLLLKLFGFLQDITRRCTSPLLHADPDDTDVSTTHLLGSAISDATLDALQTSFLDNVIYPSILECSSNDGSSVAVLTYMDVIFSNLDDGPLLQRIVEYLLGTASTDETRPASHHQPRRRTGAMAFVQAGAAPTSDYFADEGRFSLKDLILDNLRSRIPESSTAAMRLLNTLLSSHCQQSVKGLLSVIRDPAATALARRPLTFDLSNNASGAEVTWHLPVPVNSTDPGLQEIELYGSLISRIDPLQTSAELTAGYAGYLSDVYSAIQADPCFRAGHVPLTAFGGAWKRASTHFDRVDGEIQHRLSPADPLIRSVLASLGDFLCQTADENVALTGVFSAVARCPNRSLAGLLLYDTRRQVDPWAKRQYVKDVDASSDDSSDEDNDMTSGGVEDPFTARASVDLPAVYQILRDLVKQVSGFRAEVDRFDRLLSERRQGLLFADHLDEAMNLMLDVEPSTFGFPSTPTSPVPQRRKVSGFATLKSFLTPKRKTPTPSKSGSPAPQTPPIKTPVGPSVREHARDDSSPFKMHYDHVSAIELDATASPPIASGPWSPTRLTSLPTMERTRSALSQGGDDSATPSILNHDETGRDAGPRRVSLSQVLDNCVILEEFLKELVAVITARRALGVDQVGFV
jgi:hypothetical protein